MGRVLNRNSIILKQIQSYCVYFFLNELYQFISFKTLVMSHNCLLYWHGVHNFSLLSFYFMRISVVMSTFLFLILVFWAFSLLFCLFSLASSLSILLMVPNNQLLFSFIFSKLFWLSFLSCAYFWHLFALSLKAES